MFKLLDKSIEWLVTIAVVYITTLLAVRNLLETFEMTAINSLLNYFLLLLMGLLVLYQIRHYGLKIHYKGFWLFYLVYCFYILLDMTIFKRYPLDYLTRVPPSIFIYFYYLIISLSYLFCASTIYHKFNLKIFIFLSLLVCTIPSALFVQYVGIDLIQAGLQEGDEGYIPTLPITYANVPVLVIAVVYIKKLCKWEWVSVIVASAIIAAAGYVLLVYGKRGPMLWSIVNIIICYFISSSKLNKKIIFLGLTITTFFIFLDPIIEHIKETLPTTGQAIEYAIKEGDTDNRFDLSNPKHSTYLMGLENFSRSPIWGFYFRLVTNDLRFRGSYAHNIFIEVLMTMGIIGFIPFVTFLFKACKKCRKIFTRPHTESQKVFLILFLCPFLQLQTSASIVFKHDFWLFFYMLCCINILARTKDKSLQSNRKLYGKISISYHNYT